MRTIPLTQGRIAIIDDEDFAWANGFKWCWRRKGGDYGIAVFKRWENGHQISYKMHRMIAGAKPGEVVDHRNSNPLDNRRENLRLCTIQQNLQNKRKTRGASKYKGVCRSRNKSLAQISVNGKKYHLGYFEDPEDAAIAYNVAAQLFYGEFARLNDV